MVACRRERERVTIIYIRMCMYRVRRCSSRFREICAAVGEEQNSHRIAVRSLILLLHTNTFYVCMHHVRVHVYTYIYIYSGRRSRQQQLNANKTSNIQGGNDWIE